MRTPKPTVEATSTLDRVLRWRVHRQLLAAERGPDVVAIARRLAGLHAQLGHSAVTAAARGLLCFGPPRGRHVTFVAPRHWLPRWSEVDPQDALADLILTYLGAYGPADGDETARWFGLNPPPVKHTLARLADRLAWVEVDGHPGAVPRDQLAGVLDPPDTATVHLLPAFDPYVVGSLRQLDRVMTGGDRAAVSRPQGWISPTLVVDGRIAGTWESATASGALTVTVTPFRRLTRPVRAGVTAAAARLAGASGAGDATVRYL